MSTRYEVHDLEGFLQDIHQPQDLNLVLSGDDNAQNAPYSVDTRIEAFCANDQRFEATWNHRRADFLDQSQSTHDLSLADQMVRAGFSDEDIVKALKTNRLLHAPGDKKVERDDYYRRTISKARTQAVPNKVSSGEGPDPATFFVKDKFIPSSLGEYLIADDHYLNIEGELYGYEDRVYRPGAASFLAKKVLTLLAERWRQNHWEQVSLWVKQHTFIKADQIPENRGMVNVRNGMLRVADGQLLPHDPKWTSIFQVPVTFNLAATSIELNRFVGSIVQPECINILWEFLGYGLLSWLELKKMLILLGPANTGKSVLLNVVFEGLFSQDAVSHESLHDLADNRFSTAELFGKAFNISSDLDESIIKSASRLKQLTGGDYVRAERKFGHPFSFRNKARMAFSGNSMPPVSGEVLAFAERLIILPCTNVFVPGLNANPHIAEALSTEETKSALLNMALEGARRLEKRGYFDEPLEMRRKYAATADSLACFMEMCIEPDVGMHTCKQELYQAYAGFCASRNMVPRTRQEVGFRLKGEPFRLEDARPRNPETGRQEYAWMGISLTPKSRRDYLLGPETVASP